MEHAEKMGKASSRPLAIRLYAATAQPYDEPRKRREDAEPRQAWPGKWDAQRRTDLSKSTLGLPLPIFARLYPREQQCSLLCRFICQAVDNGFESRDRHHSTQFDSDRRERESKLICKVWPSRQEAALSVLPVLSAPAPIGRPDRKATSRSGSDTLFSPGRSYSMSRLSSRAGQRSSAKSHRNSASCAPATHN